MENNTLKGVDDKMAKIRDIIKELIEYNMDAEFKIIGNDGLPLPINELNIGWEVNNGAEMAESERDIPLEKQTCTKVVLFPDNMSERGD